MAKKLFLFLIAAAFGAAGAFAHAFADAFAHAFADAFAQVPLSFGVSASLISDFGGGVSGRVSEANGAFAGLLGNEVYSHGSYTGLASSIFLDARFVQLSFGHFTSAGSNRSRHGSGLFPTEHTGHSPSGLEIGLLGKFPVELSPRITVFPLAGIAYRVILSGSLYAPTLGADNPSHASALWFRLGGGMDFSLNENMFLRGAVSYGLRLRSRWENDVINGGPYHAGGLVIDGDTLNAGDHRWWVDYDSARLGHGVDVTVGIGFRLR